MGNQQTKINTKNVPLLQITAILPSEQIKYVPPFRKFKAQHLINKEKIVDCFVAIQEPSEKNVQISQHIYKDLQEAFQEKTKDITVQTVIFDEMYYDKYTYLVKNNGKQNTIKLRPFGDYESHAFGNILSEIEMNRQISGLSCPYLHKIEDFYIIQTGIEQQQHPNTQVLVFQPISTNLSEIIKYRRENKWWWTVSEFNYLVNCTLEALQKLHMNGIVHNDIRPCNIYYSTSKSAYILGQFANSLALEGKTSSKINVRTSKAYGDPELNEAKSTNLYSSDVYSLGMSLLSAFYLLEPISSRGAAPYNRKLEDKYECLKIIRNMIKPSAVDRMNIIDLRRNPLPVSTPEKLEDLIQSLRYKNRPKNFVLAKSNRAIAAAYQRLGVWEEWKQHLAQAFQIQQIESDEHHKANALKQLAHVQYCMGELSSASDYAKKSTKLYRNLGYNCIGQGNYDQSISHFTKAVECSKYFESDHDYDIAKNLQGLAIAHSEKNQYQIAKPFLQQAIKVVEKSKGKDSNEYIQIGISLAKLQTDYQQFEHANSVLRQCLQLSQNKIQINEELGKKTKAQILQEMGKNFMNQSAYQSEYKEQCIKKSEQCLAEALRLNQSLDFDNHLSIADNLCAIGEVQFRKKQYIEARTLFEKALAMRDHFYSKNNTSAVNKERANILCNIAGCDTCLGQHDKSLETYNSAIAIFRKVYGTDHNRESAMAIGNLGRVYFHQKQIVKAKQCIKCAYTILGELQGKDDPDYEHFKSIEEKINSQ